MTITLRLALPQDIAVLERLIPISACTLQAAYHVIERYELPLPNGLALPVVRMAKRLNVTSMPNSLFNPDSPTY
ncbi:hypothetical protein BZZ01_13465 [Nostocales cyanobacterium HT-58-2]|nr:hypothetical protein BZZ01_13465 [Nostocales cyanobacterium HT-58-2]